MPYGFSTLELAAGGGAIIVVLAGLLAYRLKTSDTDARSIGEDTGERAIAPLLRTVSIVANTVTGVGAGIAVAVSKFMPKSERLWHGVVKSGLRGMYKSTIGNADAIGIIHRENGQLDLRPVKWKHGTDDPTEPPRWVTKGGEEWHPGAEGRDTELIGTVPVALFDEDAPTKGSFLQSRFQAALDLGQKDKLFVPERVEQVNITVDGDAAIEGGPDAIADGGAVTDQTTYNIPDSQWANKLADVLVDLGSPGDNDGLRVSAKRYKEVYQEKTGSEEMQMQELRGRAAEADPSASKEELKRIIYAVLAGVLIARSPELLQLLMGSGVGDAVNDVNPFMLMPHLVGVVF